MLIKKQEHKTSSFIAELIEILLIVFALSWIARMYVFDLTRVNNEGMLPTLQSSDYVYVDKLFKKNLERGNLVVLDFQEDRKVIRLIGLAGDKVEIRNGYAYVNNEPLYEPYATTPITYKFDPVIVPEDHVFLLNDYRVNENDSRKLGSTPIENILGKALFCFWPVHQIKLL